MITYIGIAIYFFLAGMFFIVAAMEQKSMLKSFIASIACWLVLIVYWWER